MSVTRLQLLVFYTKHLDRTQWKFVIKNTMLKLTNNFRDQKKLEKEWLQNNPQPKYEAAQLYGQRTAVAFNQAAVVL